jgi:hypothetical protein
MDKCIHYGDGKDNVWTFPHWMQTDEFYKWASVHT